MMALPRIVEPASTTPTPSTRQRFPCSMTSGGIDDRLVPTMNLVRASVAPLMAAPSCLDVVGLSGGAPPAPTDVPVAAAIREAAAPPLDSLKNALRVMSIAPASLPPVALGRI